jgi:hypothetical protein
MASNHFLSYFSFDHLTNSWTMNISGCFTCFSFSCF